MVKNFSKKLKDKDKDDINAAFDLLIDYLNDLNQVWSSMSLERKTEFLNHSPIINRLHYLSEVFR